jgi:hypothetical protein
MNLSIQYVPNCIQDVNQPEKASVITTGFFASSVKLPLVKRH